MREEGKYLYIKKHRRVLYLRIEPPPSCVKKTDGKVYETNARAHTPAGKVNKR